MALGNAVFMDVLDAADADPQEPSPDAVDDLEAIRRATALLEEGDVAAARKVVEGALGASRPGTSLLWALADVEFAVGDPQAGMKRLADAAGVDVKDAGTISLRIRALSSNCLWREALFTIETSQLVRAMTLWFGKLWVISIRRDGARRTL